MPETMHEMKFTNVSYFYYFRETIEAERSATAHTAVRSGRIVRSSPVSLLYSKIYIGERKVQRV